MEGKFAAATAAFHQARELEPLCIPYLILT
jgi:hypothetical protein